MRVIKKGVQKNPDCWDEYRVDGNVVTKYFCFNRETDKGTFKGEWPEDAWAINSPNLPEWLKEVLGFEPNITELY